MRKLSSLLSLLLLCSAAALVSARGSTNTTSVWQTLTGDAPLVIARGGFSGILPDSSYNAYAIAIATSLPNVVAWCDVQLTKDGIGICFPDVKLDNASNVADVFSNKNSTYLLNGVPTKGWFSIDFTSKELMFVYLQQGVYSRSSSFNGNPQQILTVEGMFNKVKPPGLWLNVQHDLFYEQHKLSMRSFVLSVSKSVVVKYISSPEVNFLKSIVGQFNPKVTKLVFRFLGQDEKEPSTNQTYGSLLKNLTYIKTFASGILVPKGYIWPLDNTLYLLPHKSIVSDAHKEGLEVYASDFFSDVPFAYNYSYDPLAEYLSFIDNGDFSVDGVLSDFPITPSAAIDCYSHMGNNDKPQGPLVISSLGVSGDFPGCTDKAYSKAISDGVDVLDCPVQMTKDGIPFCLGSINLIESTTAAQSFSNFAMSIPELKTVSAIHSFNLTWDQIQTLRPSISSPYSKYTLYRNPRSKNAGNFTTLDDFLSLSKNATSVSGVLIRIENAAYLAEKQGLSVTNAVLDALSRAGYNNLTDKKVMIRSSSSAVLMKFTNSIYERVYGIDEDIRDIENSTILDIKKFANSVVISKESVFPLDDGFLAGQTNLVTKLHEFKVKVYVRRFSNEFVSQAWDFFSDPSVEINTFVSDGGIDGVITDFPATANRYRRNRCLGYKITPPYMLPVPADGLLQITNPPPAAEAPAPVLTERDVEEPPLPPVSNISPPAGNSSVAAAGPIPPPPPPSSGQFSTAASISTTILAILVAVVTL